MKYIFKVFIRFYQSWISPALPGKCRFVPTCSAYAHEALDSHGILRGGLLALHRLVRCHPFHPGGYDPVPEQAPDSKLQIPNSKTGPGCYLEFNKDKYRNLEEQS